ncbi:MAG: MoaD/ThiS family protein [Bacteroidetes bacterium]|nr:MoaD/ThiS family protein [Bacteroidota bacterium]
MLRVLFFGELAEVAGMRECEFPLTNHTGSLMADLQEKWPGLKQKTISMAVNHKIVNAEFRLKEGDEIALLPPFSGG